MCCINARFRRGGGIVTAAGVAGTAAVRSLQRTKSIVASCGTAALVTMVAVLMTMVTVIVLERRIKRTRYTC